MTYQIHIELLSDATFGRGDGVAGLVDQEIEHDSQTGLPYIRGRTLKGLLVEACADIFYALGRQRLSPANLENAARFLFGDPGSGLDSQAGLHVGSAQLPDLLRQAVAVDVAAGRLQPADVLDALTAIRRQTAVDEESGTPDEGSLRAMRVLLRGTELQARLTFDSAPAKAPVLPLLAACVASLQRGGTGRNRGRGRLRARLFQDGVDITGAQLAAFNALFDSQKVAAAA